MTHDLYAWGDESARRLGSHESDPSVYLLGAAIVDEADYDLCRGALLGLHQGGPKLHWHDADDRTRRKIMRVVETLRLSTSSWSPLRLIQGSRSKRGPNASNGCCTSWTSTG